MGPTDSKHSRPVRLPGVCLLLWAGCLSSTNRVPVGLFMVGLFGRLGVFYQADEKTKKKKREREVKSEFIRFSRCCRSLSRSLCLDLSGLACSAAWCLFTTLGRVPV